LNGIYQPSWTSLKSKDLKNGSVIRDQFLDICLRVKVVRPFLVKNMLILSKDPTIRTEKIEENGMCEALYAAAWIVGENSDLVTDPLEPLECILHPDTNRLPEHIQAIYMQSVFKLFARTLKKRKRNHG